MERGYRTGLNRIVGIIERKETCMNKKKIVIACGTGIATSTVVADKVENICKKEGIDALITQCKVSELEAYVHGADLIVTTTVIGKKYDIPVINALPFITGIGEEEVLKKIAEELKK